MSQQELEQIIQKLRNFHWGETITEMRANLEKELLMPPHPQAHIESIDADGVPADLISTPATSSNCMILYLHGGGYFSGSRQTHRRVASDLADAAQAPVLLIDYRLAPESPFPAALEDGLKAYDWLRKQSNLVSTQIALAGDSAGGNLALGIMLSLQKTPELLPACALLMSPLTDMERKGLTLQTKAETDPIVSPELLDMVANWYLPEGNFFDPIVSPLHADLSNFPPLLIHVGSQEILLDDSLRLASQAALHNVAVELKVWPELIHCFHQFAPYLEEGREAIMEAGAFLRKHLHD